MQWERTSSLSQAAEKVLHAPLPACQGERDEHRTGGQLTDSDIDEREQICPSLSMVVPCHAVWHVGPLTAGDFAGTRIITCSGGKHHGFRPWH
jgi:hypothetical protein